MNRTDISPNEICTRVRCFPNQRYFLDFCQVSSLFVLVVILLVQSYRCLEKYWSDPTFISTAVVEQSRAEIPAVTACPDSDRGYRLKVLKVYTARGK